MTVKARVPAATLLAVVLVALLGAGSLASDGPHYTMDLVVDYAVGSFTGSVRVDAPNPTDEPLNELFFRLFPNAGGIYGGASIEVLETHVDDQPVETMAFVDDTVLYVPLPEPLQSNERITVAFSFQGKAEDWTTGLPQYAHSYGLLTRSERALTMSAFYPLLSTYSDEGWALDPVFDIGDALMSDAAFYDVTVTFPAGIDAVASGTEQERLESDTGVTARYVVEGARDFSLVLVEGYAFAERDVDSVRIGVAFTPEKELASEITLERAAQSQTLFAGILGPSPFREVELVEVPLQHAAGVEFSGLIFVTSSYAARPTDTFYDIIVSHEMVHQWFYAGVGSDCIEHPWLDESLATYLSYVFLETYGARGAAAGTLAHWERAYSGARSQAPQMTIASPVYAFTDSSTYSSFVYSGAAVLLHEVRSALGDDAFFHALATYYAEHQGRIAPRNALINALEAACADDLDPQCAATLHELWEAFEVTP